MRETKRVVRSRGLLVIAETQPRLRLRLGRSRCVERARARHARAPARRFGRERERDPRLHPRPDERKTVGVIVSDSFGRPFREGTTDVAIGVAGFAPLIDLRGTTDRAGYVLRTSQVALADEIAGAADLVRGKADGAVAVVVRGVARLRATGPLQSSSSPPNAISSVSLLGGGIRRQHRFAERGSSEMKGAFVIGLAVAGVVFVSTAPQRQAGARRAATCRVRPSSRRLGFRSARLARCRTREVPV